MFSPVYSRGNWRLAIGDKQMQCACHTQTITGQQPFQKSRFADYNMRVDGRSDHFSPLPVSPPPERNPEQNKIK
jgi:hypothetical protein